MPTTMTLLNRALEMQRAAAWARAFNMTESAFAQAKKRRRLSPVLAGKLAHVLGENEAQWIAIAGLEAEPESDERNELLERLAVRDKPSFYRHGTYARRRNRGPKTGLFSCSFGWSGRSTFQMLR